MEVGAIALVQVKPEEGVAVPVVAVSQSVPLYLPHLAGRGEQTHAAPDEEVVFEIRLERFVGYLSPVHVHCVEADGVVLAVKWILSVHTVVRIVIIIIIIKRLLWRQYPRKIRTQWRNKTKGLGILVTMYNAKSRQPIDGGAKKEDRPLSMQHSTRSFGRVPRNRFSCVCDRAPAGMEIRYSRDHVQCKKSSTD